MNVLVFSTQRLASYLSSRVLSSIFLPYTPPWALTESKYALVPMFIWMPNWAAGPEKAADWPSRIDLAVTPGTCADAKPVDMTAKTVSSVRIICMSLTYCGCMLWHPRLSTARVPVCQAGRRSDEGSSGPVLHRPGLLSWPRLPNAAIQKFLGRELVRVVYRY